MPSLKSRAATTYRQQNRRDPKQQRVLLALPTKKDGIQTPAKKPTKLSFLTLSVSRTKRVWSHTLRALSRIAHQSQAPSKLKNYQILQIQKKLRILRRKLKIVKMMIIWTRAVFAARKLLATSERSRNASLLMFKVRFQKSKNL